MATSPEKLPPENLRGLDQLRVRLHTASRSLGELEGLVRHNDPLPPWPDILQRIKNLSHHLAQVLETFQQNGRFFKQAHAYPLPTFPGYTSHAMLQQLLRKKLEPGVENWILDRANSRNLEGALSDEEQKEILNWAGPASQEIVKGMLEDGDFDSNFTLQEENDGLENVVTGIKRKLYQDKDDDEDEGGDQPDSKAKENEDEVMGDDTVRDSSEDLGIVKDSLPIPLEAVLRFVSMGVVPLQPKAVTSKP